MTILGRLTAVARVSDVMAERLSLAELLDTLDGTEWPTPSLCVGWTVREVVAHLALADHDFLAQTIRIARARGDFERVNAETAREHARRHRPAELVAQLRQTAGQPRRFPLSGALDPLTDILVHGQDIVRPLGRERPMPLPRVLPVLDHVWSSFFYGTRKRFAGLRWVATDADWSAGSGPAEVRGPAGDLLLVLLGRRAGLAALSGDGVTTAAARLG